MCVHGRRMGSRLDRPSSELACRYAQTHSNIMPAIIVITSRVFSGSPVTVPSSAKAITQPTILHDSELSITQIVLEMQSNNGEWWIVHICASSPTYVMI